MSCPLHLKYHTLPEPVLQLPKMPVPLRLMQPVLMSPVSDPVSGLLLPVCELGPGLESAVAPDSVLCLDSVLGLDLDSDLDLVPGLGV